MRAKKLLNGIRMRPVGVAGDHGIQELDKPLDGVRREVVDRMTNDVGVNMLAKVKANRKAARARTPCGSLSATVGIPAKSEKRTVTGVEFRCRCGARVSDPASADGINVPFSKMPFACAGLNPA
jgi:hypothetical protein